MTGVAPHQQNTQERAIRPTDMSRACVRCAGCTIGDSREGRDDLFIHWLGPKAYSFCVLLHVIRWTWYCMFLHVDQGRNALTGAHVPILVRKIAWLEQVTALKAELLSSP
jgi:hypothetical protein